MGWERTDQAAFRQIVYFPLIVIGLLSLTWIRADIEMSPIQLGWLADGDPVRLVNPGSMLAEYGSGFVSIGLFVAKWLDLVWCIAVAVYVGIFGVTMLQWASGMPVQRPALAVDWRVVFASCGPVGIAAVLDGIKEGFPGLAVIVALFNIGAIILCFHASIELADILIRSKHGRVLWNISVIVLLLLTFTDARVALGGMIHRIGDDAVFWVIVSVAIVMLALITRLRIARKYLFSKPRFSEWDGMFYLMSLNWIGMLLLSHRLLSNGGLYSHVLIWSTGALMCFGWYPGGILRRRMNARTNTAQ